MKFPLAISFAFALQASAESPWVERLAFWVRGDLGKQRARITELDRQLATLPEMTPINSSLLIGLKTGYKTDEEVRWIDLALPESALADSIVLVPTLAKAATSVVAGYGFPVRFKIEIFDDKDHVQKVMDATEAYVPNPGCYPVVARFSPMIVKRVRFTATEPWSRDGPEVLALAEMLILSGKHNLALQAKVTSSSTRNAPRAWARANVVDMVTPLGLPVAPAPGGTLGFHSAVAATAEEPKILTLELPEAVPLDEVRLVPVRRREVPLWFDYGFPVRFKIEAAMLPDFSDARVIAEVTNHDHPTPGMNLFCAAGKGMSARYVRLTTQELWERRGEFLLALAEFQVFSSGKNITAQGTFSASDVLADDAAWNLSALNDGLTEGGYLLDLPDWFSQLDQRQVLEKERAQLSTARRHLVEQSEQTLMNASIGSAGGITLLSCFLLWRQRRQRFLETQRLHEKLARDLHDEIGSNLGSIRLICSFSSQPEVTMETMRSDLADIEKVAAESADSMRDMVQMMSPKRTADSRDWLDVLNDLSERLLRGHSLDCLLPTAPMSVEPDIETQRELYLFCKEVLHNIAKHAQAKRVRLHLSPVPSGLRVEISDNGVGFDPQTGSAGHGLGNLQQRALAMGGLLEIVSQPGQGTHFRLDLPRTKRWHAR